MEQGRTHTEAAALFRSELSEIPSIFGRLVEIRRLRRRHDEALLARVHSETFADWLSLSLRRQKGDLEAYFSSLPGHRRPAVREWIGKAAYRDVIPESAASFERKLYLADLRTVIAVLENEHAAETAVQTAAGELAVDPMPS